MLTVNEDFQSDCWEEKRISNRIVMMAVLGPFSHQSNNRRDCKNNDEMALEYNDWLDLSYIKKKSIYLFQ